MVTPTRMDGASGDAAVACARASVGTNSRTTTARVYVEHRRDLIWPEIMRPRFPGGHTVVTALLKFIAAIRDGAIRTGRNRAADRGPPIADCSPRTEISPR